MRGRFVGLPLIARNSSNANSLTVLGGQKTSGEEVRSANGMFLEVCKVEEYL